MIEIKGAYANAVVFADALEASAAGQIKAFCDQSVSAGSKIRIMPDVHAGKGCTIGTTMTITDKVIPNIVGVDIGCGMLTVKLKEKRIDGDSGYVGVQKRPEIANNGHFSKIDFRINRRPGKLPPVSDNAIDWERYIENRKSSVRCKVEHAFRIIKCQFGYKKTVYRGLKKMKTACKL